MKLTSVQRMALHRHHSRYLSILQDKASKTVSEHLVRMGWETKSSSKTNKTYRLY